MCRCPLHADRTPSLSVRVGHTNLLFHCFAGCNGEALVAWVRSSACYALIAAEPAPSGNAGNRDHWVQSRALDLWSEASPLDRTPAEKYLHARSIDQGSTELRYHPRTLLGRGPARVYRPALLARVSDGPRLLAIQRTFLDWRHARKAGDIGNPRRLLARPLGGAVRLFDAQDVLGLAEGVETAMSASMLLGIPVWAALGSERFGKVSIPPRVRRLILLPDNDIPGRRGACAAEAAMRAPGRSVETVLPWNDLNDWNDVLRAKAEGAGGRVRLAA